MRKAKKRYFFLLFCFLIGIFFHFYNHQREEESHVVIEDLPSYFDDWMPELEQESEIGPMLFAKAKNRNIITEDSDESFNNHLCRMETCFDFSRCSGTFKVYIYPYFDDETERFSSKNVMYKRILDVITESRYYTNDPDQACLFVLAINTLDRDKLSEDYVRNVPLKLQSLRHWNGGRNHLIFNLYSGSWPRYDEDLGFDSGEAILAKASASISVLRPGFDISIPLFSKNHPERGGNTGYGSANNFPAIKKHLLAFKGKRYVHGIGSEARNSLYHIHNGKDVIMVTTCKHGKSWMNWKDERCDEDNLLFDKYDYQLLLHNSSFCFVPRGRRLGSYRFLEALQAGCIPVVMSNGWVLPFSEVIDWNKAIIWTDERLLSLVPDTIRSIPDSRAFLLRQQTQILWEQYFSSIEKIVFTTLEIIKQRLPNHQAGDNFIWNTAPGGLLVKNDLSNSIISHPFHFDNTQLDPHFTAVIYVQVASAVSINSPIYRMLRSLSRSRFIAEIIIVWCNDKVSPDQVRWPPLHHISLSVIHSPVAPHRFTLFSQIKTDAVLSVDEDIILTTDEIDFGFEVWRSFPDRIVGYHARSHFWDTNKTSWSYSSKWTDTYSIILTNAAFFHKYHNYLYSEWLSPLLLKTVEQSNNCEDILMNFLVSHVTRKSPIKVTLRKHKGQLSSNGFSKSLRDDPDHFLQRQTCLNTFVALFGYMPLVKSNLRFDPILFKDRVSIHRKKYRQMESSNS